MTDIVSFDPINLRIVELDAGSDNALDATEIYSEWKFWVKQGINAKYPQAFRFEGGSQISPTKTLGITYFLMNGWKIRPAELNHRLLINGNLFVDGGVGSPYVQTLGNFTVNIETQVSNLTDVSQAPGTVLTNGDLTNVANSVWNINKETVYTTGSMGEAVFLMYNTQLGSWSIVNNSEMIMYASGSTVPLVKFDLEDKFGNKITDLETAPPFRRIRTM